jgi:hypothetical protein
MSLSMYVCTLSMYVCTLSMYVCTLTGTLPRIGNSLLENKNPLKRDYFCQRVSRYLQFGRSVFRPCVLSKFTDIYTNKKALPFRNR